jgi:tartrate dehydrogenase/decarboxylase/D-malate dehydrogenase
MMLDHLGETKAARDIESGTCKILAGGEFKTRDMGGNHTTSEMGGAIKNAIMAAE